MRVTRCRYLIIPNIIINLLRWRFPLLSYRRIRNGALGKRIKRNIAAANHDKIIIIYPSSLQYNNNTYKMYST